MATKRPEYTWINGYRELASADQDTADRNKIDEIQNGPDVYVAPPEVDLVTSPVHNHLGINVLRNWPTLYDGTNSPHGIPSWWQPAEKVDVLICGAGPSGLGLAVNLVRQGVSFRIIDKADGPIVAGRADGVQPRFLETVAMHGLATEIHEEGPLINHTAMYKDGKRLFFGRSHQSDSRYRGLHVITQGQIERIYIRDLLRHKSIVERSSILADFSVDPEASESRETYPVRAIIKNARIGQHQTVQAKFLVGCDGGTSSIRKASRIPFEGVSTDIYWGIMDCIFETDYPHAWVFGMVMSSEHGSCTIIPREDGYIRLYTQLDISKTGPISASRQARDPTFAESGGNVEVHSITPEEVLEQANRIFAPFKLRFGAPLSWFAIWRISERVAQTYSTADMRVHLAGDSAHIHSVLGAFGLNASVLDITNLGWKLGLAAKGRADIKSLLPTYTSERRKHAVKIIQVSGSYLRFICGSSLPVPDLNDTEALGKAYGSESVIEDNPKATIDEDAITNKSNEGQDLKFIGDFFKANGQFLLGIDCEYNESVIAPSGSSLHNDDLKLAPPFRVRNGVRAPNPRVAFSTNETGYLYDKLAGPSRFHIVVFASSMSGSEARKQLFDFSKALTDPSGFYSRFGGSRVFDLVFVVKLLPFEFDELSTAEPQLLSGIESSGATVIFDDRAPDEDAHTTWGVNHATGGVAIIRPDLWVGFTCYPQETARITGYFDKFLIEI